MIDRHEPTRALLEELRAATAELHAEVERVPKLGALLQSDLSVQDYLAVLKAFWRFHASQEAKLDAAGLPGALRERPSLPLLERDLRGERLAAAPARERASAAESVGILYVLEGSALGGVVIGRHLRSVPTVADRIAFFTRPAPLVAQRWREFCTWLGALDASDAEFRRGVVAGARSAFREARESFASA